MRRKSFSVRNPKAPDFTSGKYVRQMIKRISKGSGVSVNSGSKFSGSKVKKYRVARPK